MLNFYSNKISQKVLSKLIRSYFYSQKLNLEMLVPITSQSYYKRINPCTSLRGYQTTNLDTKKISYLYTLTTFTT